MATLEPADSLAMAEQALRDVVATVMMAEHGADWMANPKVVRPEMRSRWIERREQEQRQRTGHMLGGLTDLSYADLGDLDELIRSAGNWRRLFEPALGAKEDATALIRVLLAALQRVRRPVAHTRPLLPFERDLISGIAGFLRNRVTIYLSSQDPDGDHYPRIERVTDSLGNSFTAAAGIDPGGVHGVHTDATLVVGQTITFDCIGNDARDRQLRWALHRPNGPTLGVTGEGSHVELAWTIAAHDTGSQVPIIVLMQHVEDTYHRNPGGQLGWDVSLLFFYRVIPPS